MAIIKGMDTYRANQLYVYIAIAVLTELADQFSRIISGENLLDHPLSYVMIAVFVLLQVANVIRAFQDQALSEISQAIDNQQH